MFLMALGKPLQIQTLEVNHDNMNPIVCVQGLCFPLSFLDGDIVRGGTSNAFVILMP